MRVGQSQATPIHCVVIESTLADVGRVPIPRWAYRPSTAGSTEGKKQVTGVDG